MSGAEGGAGFLPRSTKQAAWRGGLRVLTELDEDVKPLRSCEDKRKKWAIHWQCDFDLQGVNISRGGMMSF